MSYNISDNILRLPGVKLDLTIDFAALSVRKRNKIAKFLHYGRFSRTNPLMLQLLCATGLSGYIHGWGDTQVCTSIFDNSEAAVAALQLYCAHMALAKPNYKPMRKPLAGGIEWLSIDRDNYHMIALYAASSRYREAVDPILNAVTDKQAITLRLSGN